MMVQRSIFWRAYFYVFALITTLVIALPYVDWFAPTLEFEPNAEDYGSHALAIIELLGLYGFAYSRKIGSRTIWKLVLVLSLSYSAYYTNSQWTEVGLEFFDFFSSATLIAMAVVVCGLFLPLWIALYRYAWTERQLWASRT